MLARCGLLWIGIRLERQREVGAAIISAILVAGLLGECDPQTYNSIQHKYLNPSAEDASLAGIYALYEILEVECW